MKNSTIGRLVWKEYRVQRGLWLSMVVMTLLGQLIALAFADPGQERLGWLFGLALGLSAFYALGCGAVLFAAEHEVETFEFQRVLPVSAPGLLASKLAFAAASIVAMFGVLWLAAWLLAGRQLPQEGLHGGLWGVWGFAALEMLVWSVLFSLVSTRPITAAILGVTAASFTVHFTVAPIVHGQMNRYWETEPYVQALPYRAILVAMVALADVWIGLRWLRVEDGTEPLPTIWPQLRRRAIPTQATALGSGEYRTGFFPLVWQHWRQSWRLMAAVWAVLGLLALMFIGAKVGASDDWTGYVVQASVVAAALMGACVFVPDQRGHSYRFFAEHGVRPQIVWLSRQLVWSAPVAVMILIIAASVFASVDMDRSRGSTGMTWNDLFWDHNHLLKLIGAGILTGFLLLAYGAAQCSSMFFRSSILAGLFGLLFAVLNVGWAGLMLVLGVPWLWSVVPIPLVLFWVTWLRTDDWILQRNGVRAWLKMAAALGVPAVLGLGAVTTYRVLEIPMKSPGFSLAELDRPAAPAAIETMRLYQRAWDLYEAATGPGGLLKDSKSPPWKNEAEFYHRIDPALAMALEASRRPEADFSESHDYAAMAGKVVTLGSQVVHQGKYLESQGKHEEALDSHLAALRMSQQLREKSSHGWQADQLEGTVCQYLVDWARNKGVSAKQIAGAITQLQKIYARTPSRKGLIEQQYLQFRAAIVGNPEAITALSWKDYRPRALFWIPLVGSLAPWERWRAVRAANQMSAESVGRLETAEKHVQRKSPVAVIPSYVLTASAQKRWQDSTPILWWLNWQGDRDATADYLRMETQRRAVLVLLGLAGWKAEHGQLPPTLDSLVGTYLEQLPTDPYSGDSFRYYRDGYPVPIVFTPQGDLHLFLTPPVNREGRREIAANEPFLWIASPSVRRRRAGGGFGEQYDIVRWRMEGETSDVASSEIEVLQHGWGLPIR